MSLLSGSRRKKRAICIAFRVKVVNFEKEGRLAAASLLSHEWLRDQRAQARPL